MTSSFSAIRPDPEPANRAAGSAAILVRAAQFPELTKVADILTESFHSQVGINFWLNPLFRLGIYEDLRARMQSISPHYICLIAIASHRENLSDPHPTIVGTVEMGIKNPSLAENLASRCLYLSNLAVSPSYRRQGVAARLLHRCEEIALEWGFNQLYLHVLENNQAAKQLYFHHGYRLQYIEPAWMSWFFWRPRRMLLYKKITRFP